MKTNNLFYTRITTFIFFLLNMITMNLYSQEMSVPANLQAALFKKIFSFDKTLQSKGSFEVAVIGEGSDEIVTAFKAAGINAKSVVQVPSGAAVIYVMPGADSPKSFTAQNGILSISGVASYAESGKVAIGIGIEGGKPKIIIHIGQLKAEKQEVSTDLLKIAKIIQ